MADAGKVAILPRGLWNAKTFYEPLDLVYYDNNSFVALKESVGVTPVDGDTWMLSVSSIGQETIDAIINGTIIVGNAAKLGGKDAIEYVLVKGTSLSTSILDYALTLGEGEFFMRLSGSSYSGNDLPDNNYAFGSAKIYKRGAGAITVSLLGAYSATLRRITSNYYNGSQWSGWNDEVITSDLANYLPLSGGRLSKASPYVLELQNTTEGEPCALISYYGKNSRLGTLGFFDVDRPIFYKNDFTQIYDILHTGNKPTGTYTGNGDATERTINTGGIGNAVLIYSGNNLFSIVSPNGAISLGNKDFYGYLKTEVNFINGVITIASTSSGFNLNGVTYYYEVL